MIYLDSCALVKLLRAEPESAALADHLAATDAPLVSSELAQVEIHRTLIRVGADEQDHRLVEELLDSIEQLPLEPALRMAARLPGPSLRSLDALHLATARRLGVALTEFLTYDTRLAAAATDAGLLVTAPK
ncbi:MAG: type II toxin-antitoxin system VapC family toxin [Egibacteraceae bacterium]